LERGRILYNICSLECIVRIHGRGSIDWRMEFGPVGQVRVTTTIEKGKGNEMNRNEIGMNNNTQMFCERKDLRKYSNEEESSPVKVFLVDWDLKLSCGFL